MGLVAAGDVAYSDVHQYILEGGHGGLYQWLQAIDRVVGLARPSSARRTPGGGSEFLMADVWTCFRPAGSGHENTTAFDDVAGLLPISTE